MLHTLRFQAMNTLVELTAEGDERQFRGAEQMTVDWFQYVESRFSRFRADSELSRLNEAAGELCLVSETMLEVIRLADCYRALTGGIYNPVISNALIRVGYGDSFDLVNKRAVPAVIEPSNLQATYDEPLMMRIDSNMKSIQLAKQTTIDLGGIVKSWAVQRLAEWLRSDGCFEKGMLNAGGDLTVWHAPGYTAEPWLVGIENPWNEEEDYGSIPICRGSVATSSTLGRQWMTNLGSMHHLIDPRTMLPSQSDVVQCTVWGNDVVACEIWAKTLCILGRAEGAELFSKKGQGYEALVFTQDKHVHYLGSGLNPTINPIVQRKVVQ
jgi:FAD:protein FMN transferase